MISRITIFLCLMVSLSGNEIARAEESKVDYTRAVSDPRVKYNFGLYSSLLDRKLATVFGKSAKSFGEGTLLLTIEQTGKVQSAVLIKCNKTESWQKDFLARVEKIQFEPLPKWYPETTAKFGVQIDTIQYWVW